MTEIPEHLLKRSKERRAAVSGEGDAGGESASGETAPVPAAAATPATPAPAAPAEVEEVKPAPPPPPYVQAATTRRKIPYWVMPVLAMLPLWAYIYQGTLEPPSGGESDPLVVGAELYAENGCAGCHGGGGGGGVGPGFTDGRLYETFPSFGDQFRWIRLGSAGWPDATYGANQTPVGGGMPGFTRDQISDADLLLIINYERSLAGEPPVEFDGGLAALVLAAIAHPEDGYALLIEEALADLEAEGFSEADVAIEGEGAPEAG